MSYPIDPTRPYFRTGIDEMISDADELSNHESLRNELLYRRGSKKVRELSKRLNCQHKVRASNAAQLAADGAPPTITGDLVDVFGEGCEVAEVM